MPPTFELRLWEDRLGAGMTATSPPGPANRIVYAVEGGATVAGGGESGGTGAAAHGTGAVDAARALDANTACHVAGPLRVTAGPSGARLWRWELVAGELESPLLAGPPVSRLRFVQPVDLDGRSRHLMRCDRVDFPLGGGAYTHTHQGPARTIPSASMCRSKRSPRARRSEISAVVSAITSTGRGASRNERRYSGIRSRGGNGWSRRTTKMSASLLTVAWPVASEP
jgi:hypothetical protein